MIENLEIVEKEEMGYTCSFQFKGEKTKHYCFIAYSKNYKIFAIPNSTFNNKNNSLIKNLTKEEQDELAKSFLSLEVFKLRHITTPYKVLYT